MILIKSNRTAELMFEKYKVPALFLAKNAVLLLSSIPTLSFFVIRFLIAILFNARFLHLLHLDVLPLSSLIGMIYILKFCICTYYLCTAIWHAFWFITFTHNLLVLETELA